MLSKIKSLGLIGINGYNVEVQVDISKGLPSFDVVGLPGVAVKESRERVRSAIKNSGFTFPAMRITCNMAPADTKKEGPIYDLPIAIGLLCAVDVIKSSMVPEFVFLGELGLNGDLTDINGVLPMVIAAKSIGCKNIVIPFGNLKEASYVEGVKIFPARSLNEIVDHFNNKKQIKQAVITKWQEAPTALDKIVDFADIRGQKSAKRALEIAAAGGHNILFIGPPGSGKTMLARSVPSILPELTFDESLEVTKIHSIAGELRNIKNSIVSIRPFRSPHHGVSSAALLGGGANAKPGEISLAHNGVLFLDEFPEFDRHTIEALRQPLEDGFVTISRVNISCTYPANFILIVSMNPCPCGNFGSKQECRCTPNKIQNYLNKISGPMLDRIDMHIEMGGITYTEITQTTKEETSCEVRKRVNIARKLQYKRYKKEISNSAMDAKMIKVYGKLDEDTQQILKQAFVSLGLSARAYFRILKVARTIADLDNSENIQMNHITEALQYRGIEKKYWQ